MTADAAVTLTRDQVIQLVRDAIDGYLEELHRLRAMPEISAYDHELAVAVTLGEVMDGLDAPTPEEIRQMHEEWNRGVAPGPGGEELPL